MAEGPARPIRKIEGQRTKLGRTMHGISYDPIHDEFFVTQPFAQAILAFRGAASGEEPPIRTIQGPLTQLADPDRLDVDPVHNEIFVPENDRVLVFRRDASGNVAPIRSLNALEGTAGPDAVAVDPVHNLIAVASWEGRRGDEKAMLLIYNRTDQGDAKPLRTIRGPRTGITGTFGLRIYPPRGWLFVAMSGPDYSGPYDKAFVGVWSVEDNGDVPPRWRIGGPDGILKQPRHMDFDPKNKALIISDKVLNAILTYSFPEMY